MLGIVQVFDNDLNIDWHIGNLILPYTYYNYSNFTLLVQQKKPKYQISCVNKE